MAAVNIQQEETEETEETVAAVTWKGKGPPSKKGEGASTQQSGGQSGQRGGRSGQKGGQRGQRGGQQETSSNKWVCFKHSRFSSRAHYCEDEERCTYSGN